MLKDPALYSVGADYQDDDPALVQKRAESPLRREGAESSWMVVEGVDDEIISFHDQLVLRQR